MNMTNCLIVQQSENLTKGLSYVVLQRVIWFQLRYVLYYRRLNIALLEYSMRWWQLHVTSALILPKITLKHRTLTYFKAERFLDSTMEISEAECGITTTKGDAEKVKQCQ